MGRLPGFDYKTPFFYMVTLKGAQSVNGDMAFSRISAKGEIEPTAVTKLFEAVIRRFHETWYCIEPIRYFVIMPDHLHLIIKMRGDVEKRVSLAVVVRQLIKALTRSVNGDTGRHVLQSTAPQAIFERDWHDWIVKKGGQLAAFTRYIRENPRRAWLRHQNARYFGCVRKLSFAGREWFAYGNADLLDLPVIEPFRCSRKWADGGDEWREAVAKAARIGPGGAGVGTFMSPCEKACGNAIFKAGGALVVLSPEGFGDRWHPTRNKEALCAKGRMLFLSLWPAENGKPDNATLYRRCHEMGDIVVAATRGNSSSASSCQRNT